MLYPSIYIIESWSYNNYYYCAVIFRIWRENKESIVGWTSRVHGKDTGGNWAYSVARVCERSMVITNAAFFHKVSSILLSIKLSKSVLFFHPSAVLFLPVQLLDASGH